MGWNGLLPRCLDRFRSVGLLGVAVQGQVLRAALSGPRRRRPIHPQKPGQAGEGRNEGKGFGVGHAAIAAWRPQELVVLELLGAHGSGRLWEGEG